MVLISKVRINGNLIKCSNTMNFENVILFKRSCIYISYDKLMRTRTSEHFCFRLFICEILIYSRCVVLDRCFRFT